MKENGFFRAIHLLHAQAPKARIGNVFQVLPHVTDGEAGHTAGEQVLGKLSFAAHGLFNHLDHVRFRFLIEELWLLLPNHVDDFKSEFRDGSSRREIPSWCRTPDM